MQAGRAGVCIRHKLLLLKGLQKLEIKSRHMFKILTLTIAFLSAQHWLQVSVRFCRCWPTYQPSVKGYLNGLHNKLNGLKTSMLLRTLKEGFTLASNY